MQSHSSNDDIPRNIFVPLIYDMTELVKLMSVFPTTKLVFRKNAPNHMVTETN